MALARAAMDEAQGLLPGANLRRDVPGRLAGGANHAGPCHRCDHVQDRGLDQKADFAIVAMTSRAMQQVELDLPYASTRSCRPPWSRTS